MDDNEAFLQRAQIVAEGRHAPTRNSEIDYRLGREATGGRIKRFTVLISPLDRRLDWHPDDLLIVAVGLEGLLAASGDVRTGVKRSFS